MSLIIRLLLPLLLLPALLSSQDLEIEPVNYKKVRKAIKKKKSPYYYPVLYQRYIDLDTSLSTLEFRYLYYGYSFQEEYKPYGTPALRDSLISYLEREEPMQQELEVAGRIAGELLKDSPFRLRETFIAAVAFEMSGNTKMSAVYYIFFQKQIEAIMSSGDGLSKETAFSVIYIPDEYEIMEVLGFKFYGEQNLIEGYFDQLKVMENELGVEELYFDVSRLIEVEFP